jgi:hypothetical protein
MGNFLPMQRCRERGIDRYQRSVGRYSAVRQYGHESRPKKVLKLKTRFP